MTFETDSKVQNESADLVEAIREIQSFGFPIVAGLIFGFDSDDEACFQKTVEGIAAAGLLSGDPSLLTALPGTPLYRRMQLAGRLREGKLGLGGHKYHTNIRYLLPKKFIIDGFLDFARTISDGSMQLQRLNVFFDSLEQRGNYVPLDVKGYFNIWLALKVIRANPRAVRLSMHRLCTFARNPRNVYWFLRALSMIARRRRIPGRFTYLAFWMAAWTTIIVKYRGISERDFDIESLDLDSFDPALIIPPGYADGGDEPIPAAKIKAQRRETLRSLRALVERRRGQTESFTSVS